MARRFHETRRERTSRFVQVGQDMVLKANNYEVTASSYKFGDEAPLKIAKKSTNRQVYTLEKRGLRQSEGTNLLFAFYG